MDTTEVVVKSRCGQVHIAMQGKDQHGRSRYIFAYRQFKAGAIRPTTNRMSQFAYGPVEVDLTGLLVAKGNPSYEDGNYAPRIDTEEKMAASFGPDAARHRSGTRDTGCSVTGRPWTQNWLNQGPRRSQHDHKGKLPTPVVNGSLATSTFSPGQGRRPAGTSPAIDYGAMRRSALLRRKPECLSRQLGVELPARAVA